MFFFHFTRGHAHLTIQYMTPLLAFNLTSDMFDILVSLVLAISLIFDLSGSGKLKRYFTWMVLFNIAMTICDIPDWLPQGTFDPAFQRMVLLVGTTFYYVFFFLLMGSFFFYECEYVSSAVVIPKRVRRTMSLFTFLCCVLVIATAPFGLSVYITADNHFERGALYPIMFTLYIIQDLLCFYIPLKSYAHMRTKELVFIFVYALIPIVALVFQALFRGYALENIATTMALLLAYINVQTELSFKNQQEQAEKLTHVLVESIEAKDQYTKGHSARVAKYTQEIAYRMGYSTQQLRDIYLIALLHDVGKMGIPDAIINKNGRLTDAEMRVIRKHPLIGATILRQFPNFVDGARYHHERYDGKGYPEGLAGHKIPECARIIAVADSYDAMTSNRSYRAIMPQQDVRREIIRGMGTQFDPRIADIMVDIIDEDKDYQNRQQMDEKSDLYI